MGMDVMGKNPTNKAGEYFRNNVWWWRGIPSYIAEAHPDIYMRCNYWQSNDGDGLNAEDSAELAARLKKDVDSGAVARYAERYVSEHDSTGQPFYHFSVENVARFAEFLEGCGGFEIC